MFRSPKDCVIFLRSLKSSEFKEISGVLLKKLETHELTPEEVMEHANAIYPRVVRTVLPGTLRSLGREVVLGALDLMSVWGGVRRGGEEVLENLLLGAAECGIDVHAAIERFKNASSNDNFSLEHDNSSSLRVSRKQKRPHK